MKKFLLTTILTYQFYQASGQNYFVRLFTDSSVAAGVYDLSLRLDNELLLLGQTAETISGKNLYGTQVVGLDTSGNLKYLRRYRETESSLPSPTAHVSLNSLLITGCTDDIHGLIVKTDSTGELKFSAAFGDTLNWTYTTDAIELPSGNILVFGYNRDFVNDDDFDIVVGKFNSEGSFLSCNKIDVGLHDVTTMIHAKDVNHFIVPSILTSDLIDNYLLLIEADSNAGILWSKHYQTPSEIKSVIEIGEDNSGALYILVNGWDTTLLLKTDATGNSIWLKKIIVPGDVFEGTDLKIAGNRIFVAGNLEPEIYSSEVSEGIYMELDSSGQLVWSKKLLFYNGNWGEGENWLNTIEHSNHSLFLAGRVIGVADYMIYFIAKSFDTEMLGCEEENFTNVILMESSASDIEAPYFVQSFGKQYEVVWEQTSSGSLSNYCSDNSVDYAGGNMTVGAYPNPANEFVIFTASYLKLLDEIAIYDQTGKRLGYYPTINSHELKIRLHIIGGDGIYFYTVRTSDGKYFAGKFLIQR